MTTARQNFVGKLVTKKKVHKKETKTTGKNSFGSNGTFWKHRHWSLKILAF